MSSFDLAPEPLRLHVVPDPVLRNVCGPVERFDRTLRDLAEDMHAFMLRHHGIGLAAPQVGFELRLFVCALEERRLAVVNPEIVAVGEEREAMVEGCLSLPGIGVDVSRPPRLTVRGFDLRGEALSFEVEGLWARVVQHETDHLNGRLITDHGPAIRGDAD
jgi:peptide deformylase